MRWRNIKTNKRTNENKPASQITNETNSYRVCCRFVFFLHTTKSNHNRQICTAFIINFLLIYLMMIKYLNPFKMWFSRFFRFIFILSISLLLSLSEPCLRERVYLCKFYPPLSRSHFYLL